MADSPPKPCKPKKKTWQSRDDETTLEMRRKARNGRPHRSRKIGFALPDGRCTMLPALSDLRSLLKMASPSLQEDTSEERDTTLPEVCEKPLVINRKAAEASRRLYGNMRIPEDSHGFRECLRLPRIVPSSRRTSPDRTKNDSGSSLEKDKDDINVDITADVLSARCLLLPETFSEMRNSVHYVLGVLISILSISEEKAQSIVERCYDGDMVILCSDFAASALQTAHILRDKGLLVRVTAKTSVEAYASKKDARLEKFAEKCRGTLRADTSRLARKLKKQQKTSERILKHGSDHHGWRNYFDLQFNSVPEDAVKAYFQAEESQKGTPKKLFARGLLKTSATKIMAMSSLTHKPNQSTTRRSSSASGARLSMSEEFDHSDEKKPKKQISAAWQEACMMMRMFIFGFVSSDATDRDATFYDSVGDKNLVIQLHNVWLKLDNDQSGRVNISEFRSFAEAYMKTHKVPEQSKLAVVGDDPAKFVKRLCERIEKLLLSKKSSFAIEDLLRITWPAANIADIKIMAQWCQEHSVVVQAAKAQIKAPTVLPKCELEGLAAVFRLCDIDGSNTIGLNELVKTGIIDQDAHEHYTKEWFHGIDRELTFAEFSEMMTPAGYRVTAQSHTGSLPDGRRVFYDPNIRCWRLDGENAVVLS